jgi:hypothetical protein
MLDQSAYPPLLVSDPPSVALPDLLDDLPPFERSSYDIQAVIRAVGNELARIEAARQQIILSWFALSAQVLLVFLEDLMGLSVDPAQFTLAQRQQRVASYYQAIAADGSGSAWESAISALIGDAWSYQEHEPGNSASPAPYTLEIVLPFAAPVPSAVNLQAVLEFGGGLGIYCGDASTTNFAETIQGGSSSSTSENVWSGGNSSQLPAASYYYAVSTVTDSGQTLACAPVQISPAQDESVTLTWDIVASPAIGYNVFRGTSADQLYWLAFTASNSFVDDGSLVPSAQPAPSVDSSASPFVGEAMSFIKRITPAHLALEVDYSQHFLVEISPIGEQAL